MAGRAAAHLVRWSVVVGQRRRGRAVLAVRMAVRPVRRLDCYLLRVSYRPSVAMQLVQHFAHADGPKDHRFVVAMCHELDAAGQHGDAAEAGDRYEVRPRNSEFSEHRGDHDLLRSNAEPSEGPGSAPVALETGSPRSNLPVDVGNAAASAEVLVSHGAIIADADKRWPPWAQGWVQELAAWELSMSGCMLGWRPGLGGPWWPRLTPAVLAQWHANGTPGRIGVRTR